MENTTTEGLSEIEIIASQEVSKLNQLEAENLKLKEERDNYKKAALTRMGKMKNDSEVFAGGEDIQAYIQEEIKSALLDKEIAIKEEQRHAEINRLAKENAELKLTVKNRPGTSFGGSTGSSTEVKDNMFSPEQLVTLIAKAKRLNTDPEKFIESYKNNLRKN